jgi:phospholipid/cholesterol/gamma-HCH transport system substrate-binding protein
METRANYLIVGLFTLAVIAAGFVFVWWFQRPVQRTSGNTFEIVFDGSVSGLRAGSSVLFNGLRVGEVQSLKLDPANPRRVVATVVAQSQAPIRADTKASLEYQGLTGIASVSLTGGEPGAPPPPRTPGGTAQITADASATQDMSAAVRRVAGQAETVLGKLDKVISDNQADLRTTVANVAKFSEALGRNADALDGLIKDASAAVKNISSASEKIDKLLGSEDKGLAADLSGAARSIRELAQRLDGRTAEITAGITNFTNRGLREFEALSADGRRTLNDFDRTVRKLERNPSQFLFGGNNVPDYSQRR